MKKLNFLTKLFYIIVRKISSKTEFGGLGKEAFPGYKFCFNFAIPSIFQVFILNFLRNSVVNVRKIKIASYVLNIMFVSLLFRYLRFRHSYSKLDFDRNVDVEHLLSLLTRRNLADQRIIFQSRISLDGWCSYQNIGTMVNNTSQMCWYAATKLPTNAEKQSVENMWLRWNSANTICSSEFIYLVLLP